MKLTERQSDALSELINIAFARTGAALSELTGHRLMDASGSDDLAAMLKQQGVDYAALPRVEHTGNALDLVHADRRRVAWL